MYDRHSHVHGAAAMLKVLGSQKDAKILDLGAGTGVSGQAVIIYNSTV